MAKSVYIHIPFCKSKCKYCSFISFVKEETGYFDFLEQEIDTFYKREELNSLYFGGGTPSLIDSKTIEKLLSKFNLSETTEITFEMNPDDAKPDYLKSLKAIGINRLSMGSQTFNDQVLKLIGRRHSSSDTIKAVENAKKAGFENISLDLIYGLPFGASIEKDIETILSLEIQHISTYGLKIEENSYFYNNLPSNLPDEDSQADMYILINEKLESAGYKRYEISNFSLPGFESKHNLNYWNNSEYYGFGLAVHGYLDGIRYSNSSTFESYKSNFRAQEHIVTESEKLEEEIFLGFRREKGLDISLINKKYAIDFEKKYKAILDKYTPNYIEKTPQGYKLTINGVLLSNLILSEFI